MNCDRFSLAEIVSASPHAAHLIGTRVVVTKLFKRPTDGAPCWAYVSMQGKPLMVESGPVGYLEDHHLKAINADVKEKA